MIQGAHELVLLKFGKIYEGKQLIDSYFSRDELAEIYDWIDLTDGTTIDDIPLTCFDRLFSLVIGNVELTQVTLIEIEDLKSQIELAKELYFWLGSETPHLFEKILMFLDRVKDSM